MSATDLGRLGPFFVVEHPVGPEWRPLSDLLEGPALTERVTWTAAQLGGRSGADVSERVAASIASLGIFARLLSPVIGAVVLDVAAPDPTQLAWRPADSGQIQTAADAWAPPDVTSLLETVVEPLIERLDSAHGVSTQIGRGNAASAINGAAQMIGRADPQLADEAQRVVVDLLQHPALADTATVGPPFVRRSCCLYYRLPGGGYCGDCVLAHNG